MWWLIEYYRVGSLVGEPKVEIAFAWVYGFSRDNAIGRVIGADPLFDESITCTEYKEIGTLATEKEPLILE